MKILTLQSFTHMNEERNKIFLEQCIYKEVIYYLTSAWLLILIILKLMKVLYCSNNKISTVAMKVNFFLRI